MPFVCVNCDGNHSSLSPKCPVYRLEKEIKTIQTLQKIPYAEARKQVVPKGGLSYSQVAAKPSQTSNIVPAVQALVPQITAAVVKEIKSLLQLQSSVPRTTPSLSQRNINLDISDSTSMPPPAIPTAKSVASNQSTSEIIIFEAEASNTDTALAMESDSAKDKRKRNQSGSTDTGSAREDDLSVIDSSAESNENCQQERKRKKMAIGKTSQRLSGR
ncbi:hypothetical protein ILUMI_25960 [Ignelater luminosus]|uniref:Uncharacterized protein n=1 Tax=Ignelater luminosus TaxID=2038154 RepID=A0A8K0CAM8_IGNLU|nr:hypothetical protein ILUMI_25960 [Ignelater luminosus]